MTLRLGCMKDGALDVMNADWFDGVEWDFVKLKRVSPPWVPELEHGLDIQYFDEYPDSDKKYEPLSSKEKKLFEDF